MTEHKTRDYKSLAPSAPEVSGLTIGGSIAVIILWVLDLQGLTVPNTVGAAIGTISAQVIHYLTTFLPTARKD